MEHLLGMLLDAVKAAHVMHWKTKSFSKHMALGELYEGLQDLADKIAEQYFGKYGNEINVPAGEVVFNTSSELDFLNDLCSKLDDAKLRIPQDGWLVNSFEELQGEVQKVRYKIANLS